MKSNANKRAGQETAALWELVLWIDQRTEGFAIEATERNSLAAGCFNVAIEHQAAIAQLCQLNRYVSALALLRSVLEALVRGMWIHRCATDRELNRFKKGKIDKNFADLVSEVEAAIEDYDDRVLSNVLRSSWKALNGFTHTGMHMVSRQLAPGRLEASIDGEEVAVALGFAGALGLIAALQLFQLTGNQDAEVAATFIEKMDQYANPAQ